MASVFELDKRYQAWLAAVDEADGEVTPELEAELSQLEDDKLKKLENLAWLRRYAEAQAKTAKEEEERLRKMRQRAENLAERMNRFARILLETIPDKKAKCGTAGAWAIQKNSQATIQVEDLAALPPGWKLFEITEKLNREMVLAETAAGNPLPPGVTVTVGDHVRLR